MNFTECIIAIALLITCITHGQPLPENCKVDIDDMADILGAFDFLSSNITDHSNSACETMVEYMDVVVEKFKNASAISIVRVNEVINFYFEEITRVEEELHHISQIDVFDLSMISNLSDRVAVRASSLDDKIKANGVLAMHWETLRRASKKTVFVCSKENKLLFSYSSSYLFYTQFGIHSCDVQRDKITNALAAVKVSPSSDGCGTMVRKLKNGLETYGQSLYEKDAIATSVQYVSYVTRQMAVLEIAISEARTRADSLKNDLNEKYARRTIQLANRLQVLVNKLEYLVSENRKIVEKRRSGTAQLAALLIACGNQTNAMKYFEKYKDVQILKEIISESFVDVDQMDNVISFIQQMPSTELKDEAGLVIVGKLPPISQYALVLDIQAKKWNASRTQQQLKPLIEKVSDFWASQLVVNNINEIENFMKINTDCANVLGLMLPDIVRKAYNNTQSKAKPLTNPISRFTWLTHRVIAFSTLVDEMVKNRHFNGDGLITVALRAKIISEAGNFDNIKAEGERLAASIWPKLPEGIQKLLFEPYVGLWSRKHSQDFYALYGSDDGKIYGYPDQGFEGYNNQRWFIDRRYKQGAFFRFWNKENGLALYADSEGQVFGGSPSNKDDEFWSVIAVSDAQYFYLKNKKNSRVLDVNDLGTCRSNATKACSAVYAYRVYDDIDTYQEWSIR